MNKSHKKHKGIELPDSEKERLCKINLSLVREQKRQMQEIDAERHQIEDLIQSEVIADKEY